MLQEAKFILPILTDVGQSLTEFHKALAQDLLDTYGEFNRYEIDHIYKCPRTHKVCAFDGVAYIVAIDYQERNKFKEIAVKYGHLCKQEAIYMDINSYVEYFYMNDPKEPLNYPYLAERKAN